MDDALYSVVFGVHREEYVDNLKPFLQELLCAGAGADYGVLAEVVQRASYYYQFCNLPSPLPQRGLAERYGYCFELPAKEVNPELVDFAQKIISFFSADDITSASFNRALGCVRFMQLNLLARLGPRFARYRLEQLPLVFLAFRLVGRRNFERVCARTYTRAQLKHFD